jgi:hypothetical protein
VADSADSEGMTLWLIGGGVVFGAWAMLSVVGNELTRRKQDLQRRYPHARLSDAQRAE